jgi:hypothetical protein
MINYFKKIRHLVVLLILIWSGFSAPQANAGVYDDFFGYLLRNDAAAVARLVSNGFDPNTTGPTGHVALHMAIMERSFSVAEALIDAPGIQLDKRNLTDETPLMLAALRGHFELAKRLVDKGADVNKPGWTALHYAASGEYTDLVQLLLDHYAYIDAQSPTGNTPLMMAVLYGSEPTIQLLLRSGADPTVKNNAQRTALDLAVGVERASAVRLLQQGTQAWQIGLAAEAARMVEVQRQADLEEAKEKAEEMAKEAEQVKQAALRVLQSIADQRQAAQLPDATSKLLEPSRSGPIHIVDLPPIPGVPVRPGPDLPLPQPPR